MNHVVQGRRIELVYMQYFNDLLSPLSEALAATDNFMPTDVLFNFGVLMRFAHRDTTCGTQNANQTNVGRCPYMPDVCTYLKGKHDYSLFWQTTPPIVNDKETGDLSHTMGPGHNLNPVSACGLQSQNVLDVNEMLEQLQPVESDWASLYLSRHSLTVDAHHAFNWNLVNRLPERADTLASPQGQFSLKHMP